MPGGDNHTRTNLCLLAGALAALVGVLGLSFRNTRWLHPPKRHLRLPKRVVQAPASAPAAGAALTPSPEGRAGQPSPAVPGTVTSSPPALTTSGTSGPDSVPPPPSPPLPGTADGSATGDGVVARVFLRDYEQGGLAEVCRRYPGAWQQSAAGWPAQIRVVRVAGATRSQAGESVVSAETQASLPGGRWQGATVTITVRNGVVTVVRWSL